MCVCVCECDSVLYWRWSIESSIRVAFVNIRLDLFLFFLSPLPRPRPLPSHLIICSFLLLDGSIWSGEARRGNKRIETGRNAENSAWSRSGKPRGGIRKFDRYLDVSYPLHLPRLLMRNVINIWWPSGYTKRRTRRADVCVCVCVCVLSYLEAAAILFLSSPLPRVVFVSSSSSAGLFKRSGSVKLQRLPNLQFFLLVA